VPSGGPAELIERVWARDPTLWTGRDEDRWLGWLDEPLRLRERALELEELAAATGEYTDVVLLGMGGSSLAPEVLRRTFENERLHVLDTTHPAAIRRIADGFDLDRTLFIGSSKSGTTLETRSQLDFFWERLGRGDSFVAVTDPGSELERVAGERGFRAVVSGEPTIGGRYSALSVFGMVPAALMDVDLTRFLLRVDEMVEACHLAEGNPGLELGEALGHGWEEGRDKILINPNPGGFGLWAEQLLAESTGKEGKGLVPVPGETTPGDDRQDADVRVSDPYELGQEFYRWEFATAVAGSILGINPFDQPNVQEAKDRTNDVLAGEPGELAPEGSLDDLLAEAEPPAYVCIQAFIDPTREGELEPLIARARETGCVVTHGLGPRYLHSTGQLHKGGPPTGHFVQVFDDPGEELPIPGREFGFARLIHAQAAGDFASLKERGRPIVRIRLEELSA
jgi:transaldolase / glucose-6-phosphate isomerase